MPSTAKEEELKKYVDDVVMMPPRRRLARAPLLLASRDTMPSALLSKCFHARLSSLNLVRDRRLSFTGMMGLLSFGSYATDTDKVIKFNKDERRRQRDKGLKDSGTYLRSAVFDN